MWDDALFWTMNLLSNEVEKKNFFSCFLLLYKP